MRHVVARTAALIFTVIIGADVVSAGSPAAAAAAPTPTAERRVHNEGGPGCGGQRPVKAKATSRRAEVRYRCTFSEEFNGEALDPNVWLVQQTWFSGMSSGNFDCLVDDPDNIAVSGGALHLTAREEAEESLCRSPAGDFTTDTTGATIATYRTFSQAYGRFSFRARFPRTAAPGAHSALWLYPQEHAYGRWPDSGEIDVAEFFSSGVTTVLPSVHYQGEPWPDSTGWSCSMKTPGKWHTYSVIWTRTRMDFQYDGHTCWSTGWEPDAPLANGQPFDRPFFIALTQVFGFNDNAVTDATPSSVTMDVNWVRVWK